MPDLRVDARERLEVDLHMQALVEHVRYRRRVSGMPDTMGVHGMPVVRVLVTALGLVSQRVESAVSRSAPGYCAWSSSRALSLAMTWKASAT